MKLTNEPLLLLITGGILLALTAIHPHDYATWWMETAPIFIAVPVLAATYKRHTLTPLVYRLLFVHALILMIGGHYTYAEVPFGDWLKGLLDLSRNPYDRIGHFAQGFVPALLAREVLLRRTPLVRGGWLFFLVTSVCLAVSACYEFIEWWSAVLLGQGADAFLGSQGDPWDTQWDMFTALIGALTAQLLFSRLHDRHLARLGEAQPAEAGGRLAAPDPE